MILTLKKSKPLICIFVTLILTSCSYSFTGSVIPPDIKTVYVETFTNSADVVIPSLAQDFTETLRDVIISRSNLKLVGTPNADIVYSGTITEYKIMPLDIAANDQARKNRLTISVRVKMENKKYPEQSWEKTFSNFEDYDSNIDIAQIQDELIQKINNKLTLDIFNQSFGVW